MPLKYRNLAETKLKQKLMATLMTLIVIFLKFKYFAPFLHNRLTVCIAK